MSQKNSPLNTVNDLIELNSTLFDSLEAKNTKIAMIKEEISSGQYQVNHHLIAAKLLEFAVELEEIELI